MCPIAKTRRHGDTKRSLHPLTFEEAIATLAQAPKRGDSLPEESGSTTEAGRESAPSEEQIAPSGLPRSIVDRPICLAII